MLDKTNLHFIGIGGISMSGLAEISFDKGYKVTGSDMNQTPIIEHLKNMGIPVSHGHKAENITDDIDLVIYTAAIHEDNPEIKAARAKGIELMTRSVFLGKLMHHFNYPICIAGTHGKTTTTSMLSHVFLSAGLDPTISVGGILNVIKGNIYIGHSQYFITEACEYCDSFLDFFPRIGIILNIEEDHMDYFKDIHQIRHSFQKFALKIPQDGFLSINGEIPDLDTFLKPITCTVETFGVESKDDWTAQNISYTHTACPCFDVYYKGNYMTHLDLHVPGRHNILNALSVCSVCHYMGIDLQSLNTGLKAFSGANQRFEIKGKVNDVTIVDDYAHHPTEILATLDVANRYPHNELYVVFQPHTYTRTRAFLDDFAKALSHADHVILTDIYAAREKDPGDISSKDIVAKMKCLGKDALYIPDFNEVTLYLKSHMKANDLIITMGAGNVNQIATLLLQS